MNKCIYKIKYQKWLEKIYKRKNAAIDNYYICDHCNKKDYLKNMIVVKRCDKCVLHHKILCNKCINNDKN